MATVILHPTWKYLPDTVSWPDRSKYVPDYDNEKKWNKALTEASRHLVDIAEEDWHLITVTVATMNGCPNYSSVLMPYVKQDVPYKIDAEFEVVEQRRWAGRNGWFDKFGTPELFENRQIARLVKPKEKVAVLGPRSGASIAREFYKLEQIHGNVAVPNPTDSVTSDGTTIKVDNRPRFTEASKARMREWTEGERRDAINYLHELNGQPMTKEPTETQYELWNSVEENYIDANGNLYPEVKTRFRIERI